MISATSSTATFILMTLLGMQILYQVYAVLARSNGGGSGDKKGEGAIVGIAALVCHYMGIYLLLYLGVRVILGVIDVENARYTGLLAESTARSPGSATEAMLFD